MCEYYNTSQTLVKNNPFVWCRHGDGSIAIHRAPDEPARCMFTADQYYEVLDLLSKNPDGTQLSAAVDRRPPPDSIGALMASFSKSLAHGSSLAAIAVDEGYAEPDYRGNHNGGLWLIAATDGRDRSTDENDIESQDKGQAQQSLSEGAPELSPDAERTAGKLRALAKQVESAEAVDKEAWTFDLSDVNGADTDETLDFISTWERDVPNAMYLYRFRVADSVIAGRCHDALARAKSNKTGGRRFSRLNKDRQNSTCLYIGSSRSLTTRIRQHLGLSHPGTYALQIGHWQSDTPLEGTIYLEVSRYAQDTSADVLQALEDDLWFAERPRFGRMGAR